MWKRRSPFLFLLSLIASLVIAQISPAVAFQPFQYISQTLVEQGQNLYGAGRYEDAARIWQKAADDFANQGDRLNQAMALGNLALSQQAAGRWNSARSTIATSITILETLPLTPERQRILAASLDIRGAGQLATGETEKALATWQQARDIYDKIGNSEGARGAKINQAQALQDLGLYTRACQVLLDSLAIESPDCQVGEKDLEKMAAESSNSKVLALRSLGNTLRAIGQPQQSQAVLLKAWQLAQGSDRGPIYLSLGNTLNSLAKLKGVGSRESVDLTRSSCIAPSIAVTREELYRRSADCYRRAAESPSALTRVQARLNLLALSLQTGYRDEITTLIAGIYREIDTLPSSRASISARLKLAQNLLCLRSSASPGSASPILQSCPVNTYTVTTPSLSEIAEIVNGARQQAQSLGDEQGEANSLGYMGAIEQEKGNMAEAQELTEQALKKISSFDAPYLAYLWQWQLGRLYRLQGQNKEALVAYNLAFQMLQSLRQDLVAASTDVQYSFGDNVEPVYRELADLLLDNSSGELGQQNLRKARDVIEALQLAELNNFFQEACLEAKPQQIEGIDRKAAIVYSIVLKDGLGIILSLPGQPLRYYKTLLKADTELEKTIDELFARLNPFIIVPDQLAPYQKLYDWLIRPAREELDRNGTETIVFVLDGVLRGVPVSALHDGQKYLVQDYNLVLTPGLQLLDPRRLSVQKSRVLVAGLSESRQGFPPLPAIKQEVKDISTIVSAEIMLDSAFTRSRLEEKLQSQRFSVVHLATHGQFSSQAQNTFLLSWDERINVKSLDRLVRQQERLISEPIELMILSACQTAAGDKRAGLGLAGVAVRSGARSTIATLWSVQDQSTANLMSQLYTELNRPGINRASALRQAQVSVLNTPQYQHPFYWAPFVLVGNWL